MTFKNKNILITGATKGLGKEIACAFHDLSANLILSGRSSNLIKELKNKFRKNKKHFFFEGDLLIDSKLKEFIYKTKKKFKNLDVIIHCMGGSFGINEPFENWNKFSNSIKGNLGVAIELNNNFIPNMIKRKKGNIVHVGSVVSHEANASIPYVTSKASISGYVRSMGNYLSNYGIVLSGILPGGFFGDNNAMARFKYYKPKEYFKFVKKLPEGKMPHAKDYIEIIKLLSLNNSKIFSGSLLYLDNGQSKTVHQVK